MTNIFEGDEDPIIQSFLEFGHQFHNELISLLEQLKTIKDIPFQIEMHQFLINSTKQRYRLMQIIHGNFLINHFVKLNYEEQIPYLDLLVSNVNWFTNRQLCKIHSQISNVLFYMEYKGDATKKMEEKFTQYRQFFHFELNKPNRVKQHNINEIKQKYIDNVKEWHHELVNCNQLLADLRVLDKNKNDISQSEVEEYLKTLRKTILPECIQLFSVKELQFIQDTLISIINLFKHIRTQFILDYISTRGENLQKFLQDQMRLKKLLTCTNCNQNKISPNSHPLCQECYNELIKNFPEKYFPKDKAYESFRNAFNIAFENYNDREGYISIKIDLPFTSPFTVMDLEATGDINKDRSNYITTMGVLKKSVAIIYQLIDFSKHKDFKREMRSKALDLPRPIVAYNYEGSERPWLRLYVGGWIDIQKKELEFSRNKKPYPKNIKMNDLMFQWDDITGVDCPEECSSYQEDGVVMHLIKIAYHNFIDLLKEYQLGLTTLEVHDYLKKKKWDYLKNKLLDRHICQICFNDFTSAKDLDHHKKALHRKR